MKVCVIGSGGREHAIIKKLKENDEIKEIFSLPGNGGIKNDAVCVSIKANEIDKIVEFATQNQIDFVVVAPDDPLVLGAVDLLHQKGIPCFGPDAKAAAIEGSKVFSKNLMKKYGIPTADYSTFENAEDAISYLEAYPSYPVVIKADGLALGKGVLICENKNDAISGVKQIMVDKAFGESGNQIVIEEFLKGPEVSVLSFTDGKTIVPMVSSMDHKRALDGDNGLNTGGMGTIAPNPYYTEEIAKQCMDEIFVKTIEAMRAEGRTFKGCLYFGLMLTKQGPKVIEYNCRFGDPETQVVLPLLVTDLFTIMKAVEEERLNEIKIEFEPNHACCVMIASDGYPVSYQTGNPITFGNALDMEHVFIYHSGTRRKSSRLVNFGGRVLGVTGKAKSLIEAIALAYEAVNEIEFSNAYYRKDIGQKALLCPNRPGRNSY